MEEAVSLVRALLTLLTVLVGFRQQADITNSTGWFQETSWHY